jgi:hypothetical protein
LHKVCKELEVPLPGRGHWAKVRAGIPVPRTPLPGTVNRPDFPGELRV